MHEVLQAFGIDWRLIIIQIVNFALLLSALWYFLYNPVLKILSDRKSTIEEGVRNSEEAAKLKSEAHSEKVQLLSEAEKEAEKIMERTRTLAKQEEQELTSEAEKKAAGIIKNAEEQSGELKQRAHRESEAEIAKLAVLAAEKVLRERI